MSSFSWNLLVAALLFATLVLLNASGWGILIISVAVVGANFLGYAEARSED